MRVLALRGLLLFASSASLAAALACTGSDEDAEVTPTPPAMAGAPMPTEVATAAPGGKPEIGATVVETEFQVQDCSSGVAVTNPETNTELVADCEALLGLRDTIRGTGRLNWTAGKAMTEWMGVTVSGTPQRVTALNLADLGLDGELSGLLGNLTRLATLDLSGNALTGMLPSKLALLTNLTTVTISGTVFDGCAPTVLGNAATSDVTQADCGAPPVMPERFTDQEIPGGTYMLPGTPGWRPGMAGRPAIAFDIPPGSGLLFRGIAYVSLNPARPPHRGPVLLGFWNAEQTVTYYIDLYSAEGLPAVFGEGFTSEGTVTGYTRSEYEAIFDRITESIWRGAD